MNNKGWHLRRSDPALASALAEQLNLSPLAAAVLAARGLQDAAAARDFLYPRRFHDPMQMRDMPQAVERIRRAIELGELITVYGDYDCDGVTATALLVSYLQSAGANISYYLPDRYTEGYGLNKPAVKLLAEHEVRLIVTVDNGISAREEIAYANSLGVDVVVTDHHTPPPVLPDAVAVVDPHRQDCPYPFEHLAGVGVAFKLVCALEGDNGTEMADYYAHLVALGTIADLVPLKEENRLLVQMGLARMADNGAPGLESLAQLAGISLEGIASEQVAFGLAPRMNAAGRMETAEVAADLLLSDDEEEAQRLAGHLDGLNRLRRQLEEEIFAQAEQFLAQEPERLFHRVLIAWGEGWSHGVIGIVSAKLMQKYLKPCILMTEEDGQLVGSARSIPGFSMVEAVASAGDLLTKFGGHPAAAGFSMKAENREAFCQRILSYAAEHHPVMPVSEILIDAVIPLELAELSQLASLTVLEPFGCENETPVFAVSRAVIGEITPMGGGKHLRLRLEQGGRRLSCAYFFQTPEAFPYRVGEEVDAALELSLQTYQGAPRVSARILDVRPAGLDKAKLFESRALYERWRRGESLTAEECGRLYPGREYLAALYRRLRREKKIQYGMLDLCWRIDPQLELGRLYAAVDVLKEFDLARSLPGGGEALEIGDTQRKVNLQDSRILSRLKERLKGDSVAV